MGSSRNFVFHVFLLAISTLWIQAATAQDQLGLFFDEAGTQTSIQSTQPYQQINAYLILKDPTLADGVTSWECIVEARTYGPEPIISWELNGQALNVAEAPSFLVGMGEPLPSEGDVLLATALILVPEAGQNVTFYIHPFDPPSLSDPPVWGYPVFVPAFGHGPDGELVPAGWASGCEANPVAVINDDGQSEDWHLSGAAGDLNFGYVQVGETEELHFAVAATGDLAFSGTVSVTSDLFQYRQDNGYFTDLPTSFRLEPGEDLDFEVRFSPQEEVVYWEQLVIQVCDQTFTVNLVGGFVEGGCVVPWGQYDYGLLPVGAEARRGFLVGNTGDGVLNLDPVIDSDAFTITLVGNQAFPMILYPGDMEYVYVTFAPLTDGVFDTVMDLGPSTCPLVILQGSGSTTIPPECDLDISDEDFGPVSIGFQESEVVNIMNTGGNILEVDLALVQEGTAFSMDQEPGLYELGPNQELQILVDFHPDALGNFSADLQLGTVCGDITFTGEGRYPVENYVVPDQLVLPSTALGASGEKRLTILNNGETPVSGDLQIAGDAEFTLTNTGPFTIQPFEQVSTWVIFMPEVNGPHAATVSTGLTGGETVPVSGYGVPVLPDPQNVLGMHFNESYLGNQAWTTEVDEIIYAYLVLHNPSSAGGVAGWELCLDEGMYPRAEITNWDIVGSSSGPIPGNCPSVMLDAPLPPSEDMLLAILEILVPDPYQTVYFLEPHEGGALPDYPSYVDGGDGVTVIPMDTDLNGPFAVINQGAVDVQIPDPPQVTADGGNVRLEWPCETPAEGYHVYRRVGQDPPLRLTDQALGCSHGQAVFMENPQMENGTRLFYSTSAVIGGQETARSNEVEFVVSGGVPSVGSLLPCYPNPFNPETRIPFTLSQPGNVKLSVFNLRGRLVAVIAEEHLEAGIYERVWSGRDHAGRAVPSGSYSIRLETGGGVFIQKATLLK